MMLSYSKSIKRLIDEFSKLPTIGPKTAERLVFYLLRKTKEELAQLASAVEGLKDSISICSICKNFSETNPCNICSDDKRNKQIICVVAKPQDLFALEKTSEYEGRYHILGGLIDPLEGITPELLTVKDLGQRIIADEVKEIVLALNSDLPGETTILYLTKFLKQFNNIEVTRLAQGLPIGSDLEYADEVTLTKALKGRRKLF